MLENWKTEPRFAQNGVNGSICSILVYLSEVWGSVIIIFLGVVNFYCDKLCSDKAFNSHPSFPCILIS